MKTPHYWRGHLPIAFVFSVPGSHEKFSCRPVAGATGENLATALEFLHSELPEVFSSTDRYAYRITNAYCKPLAKLLGDRSSEAKDLQIKDPSNIARVLLDLDDCNLVILCGLKAQLLTESIRNHGKEVVCSWHISNQSLSGKFSTIEVSKLSKSYARRQLRVKLWAQQILNTLPHSNSSIHSARTEAAH